MQIKNPRKVSQNEILIATGMREIGAQARVGALGTFSGVCSARLAQLDRDRQRALRRGNQVRADELDAQIKRTKRLDGQLAGQKERESIVPSPVPREQAMVRGRVTDEGMGRKGIILNLLDAENGKEAARGASGENGAFELAHQPTNMLTLRVTDSNGAHILDQTGIAGPGAGGACYLEVAIDRIVPMPPPPEPPEPDSEPSHTKVPSLRGLTRDEAEITLKSARLNGQFAGELLAPDLAGRVVEQEPKAGSVVERGATVRYQLGAEDRNEFPDLTKQPLAEATAIIRDLDLTLQMVQLERDPELAGLVIKQLPEPGAPFNSDTRVTLSVGTGEPKLDLGTAEILIAREAARSLPEMNSDELVEKLRGAELETLKDLNEVASSNLGEFQERTGFDDTSMARRVQRIALVVSERFSETQR